MTHCYAAFTETDALLGEREGGDAAHCENDCAEVITSGCGGGMSHCTETDTLLGNHGGGHAAHWTIDSADGVSGGGEGEMASCAALAETDRLTGACEGHDPAQWKNSIAENIAHIVHKNATFLETNHSIGKPVSNEGHGPAHWMPNSSKTLAHRSSNIPIEGSCDKWIRTVSAVMEHVLRHDGGMTLPEIKNSDSMGNAEEVCSAECVATELIGALERFLERSEVCLNCSLPTHCRASALSSHLQTPGSVVA